MKSPDRLSVAGILILTALLTSGSDLISGRKNGLLIQYDGTVIMANLRDSVTVLRDERGIPHIYATCEHDLYMATGYITAQDRLWQMDLVRRSAAGRLSEIFGEPFIQADIFTRCLNIYETADVILKQEDPVIMQCLEAYTDGVNSFIRMHDKKLPLEFRLLSYRPEPWSARDIVSIIGLMGWNLDYRNLTAELFFQQLINRLGIEKATELVPDWQATPAVAYPEWEISGEYYIYRILAEGPDEWVDDINTDEKETLDDIVMQSFREAVSTLVREYGKNLSRWEWGRIHTVAFLHPLGGVRILGSVFKLNSGPYPIGGSDHTVCPYFTYKQDFKSVNGASMRDICNTANWDESWSVIPGGQSGVPGSEYYLSQVKTYLEGGLYKDHFSDQAVMKAATHTLILKP
ncbi:MAG: penicillin acylase family protein [Bacteroidales bacterium]|nr:penicillin acylase family protein [Bacteroidales bacterium]